MTGVIERASSIACTGAFLVFLDTTIVNIAFPDISASFPGAGRDLLSWVLDGYFVVIAALLVPAGGLADRFGHKRVFLLGLAGFTAASLLCAVAPSLEAADRLPRPAGGGRGDDRADLAGDRPRQLPGREAGRPGSGSGAPPRRPRRRPGRPSAAPWSSSPTGASSSSSTCRSAPRVLFAGRRLPADAARSRQPPARPAGGADAGARPGGGDAGDRRGQRLGLDLGRDARLPSPPPSLLLGAVVARSRRHPRPIVEPALFAHRSFTLGNLGTLLFAAAFFSLILGNVLFLTSIWGYTRAQRRRSRPCPGRR